MAHPCFGLISAIFRAPQRSVHTYLRSGSVCLNHGCGHQQDARCHQERQLRSLLWNAEHLSRVSGLPAQACVLVRCLSTQNGGLKPPKRPLSSFFLFLQDKRASVVNNNPGVPVKEISKIVGDMWRNIPQSEKQLYIKKGEEEKTLYKDQHDAFLSGLTDVEKEQLLQQYRDRRKKRSVIRKRRVLKDLGKPKQPMTTGYMVFCKQRFLAGDRGMTKLMDYAKQLGDQWKKLSNEEKQPHVEEAKHNRDAYQVELNHWEAQMLEEGHPEVVRGYKPPKPPAAHNPRAKRAPRKRVVKKNTTAKPKSSKTKPASKGIEGKGTKRAVVKNKSSGKKKEPKVDTDPSWMRKE